MKIAVCVHLYHVDMWDEIETYLKNLTLPYKLYVNLPYNTCETINLTPYSYQIDAFNKLSCPERNTLTMPCGTGKTYVSYLLSASYKNIIILSPLISTAEQLYIFYKRYYNNSSSSNISVFNCMNKNKVIDLEKQNIIIFVKKLILVCGI